MRHYSELNRWVYYVFNANVSSATKHLVSDVISTGSVQVCSAGTTYFSENYFKTMFTFHWISILLIRVTFDTYLANIVFGVTWPLNVLTLRLLLNHTFCVL